MVRERSQGRGCAAGVEILRKQNTTLYLDVVTRGTLLQRSCHVLHGGCCHTASGREFERGTPLKVFFYNLSAEKNEKRGGVLRHPPLVSIVHCPDLQTFISKVLTNSKKVLHL